MTAPELSDRELELLRRVAEGATYRQIARDWVLSEVTVRGLGHRLLRKLDANTIAHAVHLAHVRGVIGPYPDCGDRAAYQRHIRRREPTDPACRAANARWAVQQRAGLLALPAASGHTGEAA